MVMTESRSAVIRWYVLKDEEEKFIDNIEKR